MLDHARNDDTEFFSAFADLLERFPEQKGRFNLRLDHSHFPLDTNEMLMEYNDPSTRMLTTKVIRRDQRDSDAIEVEWRVAKVDGDLRITVVQDCCGDPD